MDCTDRLTQLIFFNSSFSSFDCWEKMLHCFVPTSVHPEKHCLKGPKQSYMPMNWKKFFVCYILHILGLGHLYHVYGVYISEVFEETCKRIFRSKKIQSVTLSVSFKQFYINMLAFSKVCCLSTGDCGVPDEP